MWERGAVFVLFRLRRGRSRLAAVVVGQNAAQRDLFQAGAQIRAHRRIGGTRRAADCLLEGLGGPAAVVDLADPAAFAFGPEDVAVPALFDSRTAALFLHSSKRKSTALSQCFSYW